MTSEIAIIKVPAPLVTLQRDAEREDVSQRIAYRWVGDIIPCRPSVLRIRRKGCMKADGPIRICHAHCKAARLGNAQRLSRFSLVIGG